MTDELACCDPRLIQISDGFVEGKLKWTGKGLKKPSIRDQSLVAVLSEVLIPQEAPQTSTAEAWTDQALSWNLWSHSQPNLDFLVAMG